MPYLAITIGPDSFGKLAFASGLVVWFDTICDWGFNYTATRDLAINRDNNEKISEIFSAVFWSKVLLLLASTFLLLLIIYFVPIFNDNSALILFTFLSVPGKILFPDWFFQAMERMKYVTILQLFSRAFFSISIFIFIKSKSDYVLQPILMSLGSLVSGFLAMYLIIFRWKIKLLLPNFNIVLHTIKKSTNVFLNNLAPNLYFSFSFLLLGYFCGSHALGILDAGNKFVALVTQLFNVISRTFFPFLSRRIDKHQIYVKINIILAFLATVFLLIFAPFLISVFFPDDFHEAIIALRIMSFSILLLSIHNSYGTHYLLIRGYERKLRNGTFVGSIVGFISAFFLIKHYTYIGASLTIVISQFIMAILVYFWANSIKKANYVD